MATYKCNCANTTNYDSSKDCKLHSLEDGVEEKDVQLNILMTMIRKMVEKKFYGELQINFKDGKMLLYKKTESGKI